MRSQLLLTPSFFHSAMFKEKFLHPTLKFRREVFEDVGRKVFSSSDGFSSSGSGSLVEKQDRGSKTTIESGINFSSGYAASFL